MVLALEETKYIAEQLWDSIPQAFPKPVDCSQIQECKRLQEKSIRDFLQLCTILQEYHGLPIDTETTKSALNSVFPNRIDRELPALTKQTERDWEVLLRVQCVTHAAYLAQTFDEAAGKKSKSYHASIVPNIEDKYQL